MLHYKTREGSTPRGKARVYFCCHPEDTRFFDGISDLILKYQNCAVWYGEPEEEELQEMQLFVMPVTQKLLTTENRGMKEFHYAIDHHIPVLPLMQQAGLVELFAEKCGDLQFLDPYQQDETAIGFEEKLEKFLATVLIGDELAAKVRAAFDAYIFLSYRKKDRKYARELIRLIHQNESFRDIAIWFDEFLTPGEDFNREIADALDKSKLFALAVTPSLLEQDNYIMRLEYPMARKAEKAIVPAELVATDREALLGCYDALPEAVDAYDDPALGAALLQALQDIALRSNDTDPAHNFLIGLAYRDGIDVEVDQERAVALLASAADAGLVEAAGELVLMYRTGKGVARSHEQALIWQGRKVALMGKAYEENPDTRTGCPYYTEVAQWGDYLLELGRPEEAIKKYEEAAILVREIAEKFDFSFILRDGMLYEQKIASIWEGEGQLIKAREAYERIYREIEQWLADYHEHLERFEFDQAKDKIFNERDLAVALLRLGGICWKEGNLSKAKEYLEKSLEISREDTDRDSTYEQLGLVLADFGEQEQAREMFEKCLQIREMLLQRALDREDEEILLYRRNLANICGNLGTLCMDQDAGAAERYFRRKLEQAELLDQALETPETKRFLGRTLGDLGQLMMRENKLMAARDLLNRYLEIAEVLVKETAVVADQIILAVAYDSRGVLCQVEGDLQGAIRYYELTAQLQETIARRTENPDNLRDLAMAYYKLGAAQLAVGENGSGEQNLLHSTEILEDLVRQSEKQQFREDLSRNYRSLGDQRMKEGDGGNALGYYKKALAAAEEIPEKGEAYSLSCECLGTLFLRLGNMGEAKRYYEEALRAVQQAETARNRTRAAQMNARLGDLYRSMGEIAPAEQCYEECLRISAQMAEETPTIQLRRDHAICYQNLGMIHTQKGDLQAARQDYLMMLSLAEELAKEAGTADLKRLRMLAYTRLGEICAFAQDPTGMKNYYTKALPMAEELLREVHTAEARRDVLVIYDKLGDVAVYEGNAREAKLYYESLYNAAVEMAAQNTPESKADLAVANLKMASVSGFLKRQKYYRTALTLCEELVQQCPGVKAYEDMLNKIRNM
ncbi:MAG: tetratricopeptide repeat protein [Clostridia bacterium]|nr:tetratricopeptide repeat protein [Clostridia bacterium]